MVVVKKGWSRVLVFYGKVGCIDGAEYGRIYCQVHCLCVTVLVILKCQNLYFVFVELIGKSVVFCVGYSCGV